MGSGEFDFKPLLNAFKFGFTDKFGLANAIFKDTAPRNFDGETLTLVFKSETMKDMVLKKQLYFENALFNSTGKKIKLSAVVDKNLSNADFYQISDEEKNFLKDAMNIFQSDNVQIMKSEE